MNRLKKILPIALLTTSVMLLFGFAIISNAEASLDNKGTDFILGFLPNYSGTGNVELHLTGDIATNVRVDYPVNSPTFTTTVAIVPGNVTIVSIPTGAHLNWVNASVRNNAVHAFSDEEFVCYMVNRQTYTSDASLALPIDTFNIEYFAMTHTGDTPEFVVVAAYDGTSIEITLPSSAVLTATLNRGEGYFYSSSSDLTGALIKASKPVGVTSGNRCVNYDGSACDHIFEMLPPVVAWEKIIPAVNVPETSLGVRYTILASADNTTVTYNGAPLATLDRGQSIHTNRLNGNYIFEANKPIMVGQFLANRSTSGGSPIGDPAIGILTPIKQFDSAYTFSTVGGEQFAENNVTIVAHLGDVGTLRLDGVPIPAGQFSQIGTSDYYATIQYIADGVHSTFSTSGHGITVEGFHWYDSYLYTGGALFEFVNPQGDANPPICEGQIISEVYYGTARDNRPTEDTNGNGVLDPGEDLNGNGQIDKDTGIYFVELLSGTNVTLTVNPFTPGTPIVNYTVELIDPNQEGTATVRAKDGAGNSCQVDIVLGEAGPEICGDFDHDDDVDRTDYNLFLSYFGSRPGKPNWNPEADFDGDGVVGLPDFAAWYQCYKAYISP